VHDNVADGDEETYNYILDWQASGLQHPEDPGRATLSMRGLPGAGKGVFALYYGGIFGRHFLHATHKAHVTGKFNAHQAETCLIFVDEALYADIRSDAQILKTMTSETTKILERKGIDAIQIDNFARMIFSTNDEHPIQIEDSDRRYCALYVKENPLWADLKTSNEKADARRDYFLPIINEMKTGGREALLGLLLKRNIRKFNPERIPETPERQKQKLLSASSGDKLIIEFAQEGRLPGSGSGAGTGAGSDPCEARANGHDDCLYPTMRNRGGNELKNLSDQGNRDLLASAAIGQAARRARRQIPRH
jgi:hypothetical protein